ncbi:hypothetical protein O59_002691 [Cellvibrio sp. BR]|nr:hypothetical protein O59_002691 [Cellvibrio sp. BR]
MTAIKKGLQTFVCSPFLFFLQLFCDCVINPLASSTQW